MAESTITTSREQVDIEIKCLRNLRYPDGNRRVARTLMNWHLIKRDFLPIAVSQDRRTACIHALAQADAGDLWPLVAFRLQSSRRMVHIVLQDTAQSLAIPGSTGPAPDCIRDTYPGWRK